MTHLTIRNVPDELNSALKQEMERRGASLNQTLIDLLSQALGVGKNGVRSNGLGKFSGQWSEEEFAEFEAATEWTRRIDPEMWE